MAHDLLLSDIKCAMCTMNMKQSTLSNFPKGQISYERPSRLQDKTVLLYWTPSIVILHVYHNLDNVPSGGIYTIACSLIKVTQVFIIRSKVLIGLKFCLRKIRSKTEVNLALCVVLRLMNRP